MTEKPVTNDRNAYKERFEFIFTINDFIICQRYFRIDNFKTRSLHSAEFTNSFRSCVNMIKQDLEAKSRIYLWYTAPLVFDNAEKMNEWLELSKAHKWKTSIGTIALIKDSDTVYTWNGEGFDTYEGYYNRSEYIKTSDTVEEPSVLKFAFLDNGKEIISEVWDGSVYPRFVRNNIDLSNTKNRYEVNGQYSPFEAAMIRFMISGRTDIVPQIVRELCNSCSGEEMDYTTEITYGKKKYSLDPYFDWWKYTKKVEKEYAAKTAEYKQSLYY